MLMLPMMLRLAGDVFMLLLRCSSFLACENILGIACFCRAAADVAGQQLFAACRPSFSN